MVSLSFMVHRRYGKPTSRSTCERGRSSRRAHNRYGQLCFSRLGEESLFVLGVLTKPDTLTKGAISSRQKWKDVLQDRSHKLNLGYYCVRLPDDEERTRNISHSEMQRIATELFDTTAPWNDVEARDRFGISNLVSNLSKLLIGLIENTLVLTI
jgi:hypothetical protein